MSLTQAIVSVVEYFCSPWFFNPWRRKHFRKVTTLPRGSLKAYKRKNVLFQIFLKRNNESRRPNNPILPASRQYSGANYTLSEQNYIPKLIIAGLILLGLSVVLNDRMVWAAAPVNPVTEDCDRLSNLRWMRLNDGLNKTRFNDESYISHLLDISFGDSKIGKISEKQKYAWGENAGWIDFHPGRAGLKIGSNVLAGWIFIKKFGWVHLGEGRPLKGYRYSNNDRRDYGVNNDGEGNLTGWGWGENIGWVNFGEVRINREGIFSGTANSPKIGLILFNCAGPVTFLVKTDPYPWRKIGVKEEIKLGRGTRSTSEDEALNMGCSGPALNYSPQSIFFPFCLGRKLKILDDKLTKKIDLDENAIVFRIEAGECNERAPPDREKNLQKFENRSCSTGLIFREATSRKPFYNLALL